MTAKDKSNHQVARAAVLVMVAFAISRILGLVRQMVFSRYFGTGPEMDAYVAALRIPEMIFLVAAGGALGSAFIPAFTARLAKDETEAAWRLASAIINWLFIVLTTLSLLTILVAPWLVRTLVAPAFSPALQQQTVALMRVMLLSTTIFGISGIVMGILNAHQHFLLPAVAPILYNLALIAGAFFGGRTPVGPLAPAIAMVVGAILHFLVQVPGLLRYGARYFPVLGIHDPEVRKVAYLMGPRVLGVAAVQINFVVTNNLASGMGAGAIAALDYAWRLMLLPVGVFAQAVGTAVFPTFSAQAARNEQDLLRATLSSTLRIIVAVTLPASAGLIVMARPVITLIFEGGAFTGSSTSAVVWALSLFALGLAGHALIEILARAFYALHDTWTPATVAGVAVALNVLLGLSLPVLFERAGLPGYGGLALANALAALVEMAILLVLIGRRVGGLEQRLMLNQSLRVILATAGMALGVWLWLHFVPQNALLQSVTGIGLGIVIYLALATLLGVSELKQAVMMVLRRAS